jgi:hypothetical protein
MKLWPLLIAATAIGVALSALIYLLSSHPGDKRSSVLNTTSWQRMASPGALSKAHTFLEHDCAACHTPIEGPDAAKCIACHASNESVLQRQPTAFHAGIGGCRVCHIEHRGVVRSPTDMDHAAVASIGLRQLKSAQESADTKDSLHNQLLAWIERNATKTRIPSLHPDVTASEAVLNCSVCHANEDRHFKLFGQDCAQCHATSKWTIPEFRHPSPRSTDCVQCHQAPPSHYMGHFHMVSKKVAGKPHADASQCYLCHQTTSWNDIKGVGWYKHH